MVDFQTLEKKFGHFAFRYLSSAQRRRIWLKLAKLMSNGVQQRQALEELLKRRLVSNGRGDPVAMALQEWLTAVENGSRLSIAISGWVTKEEEMLIAAGEQSGRLIAALESTTRLMTARKEIAAAVKGGLGYPIILTIVAFAAMYFIGYKAVPAFTQAAGGTHWTGLAAGMVGASHFIQNWLIVVIAFVLILVGAFLYSLPRYNGDLRVKLDRYAPYSVYRIMYGSSWLIAMSALLSAGVRSESALEQLSDGAAPWMKLRLKECLIGVRSGRNLGDALIDSRLEFPDREILDDMAIYDKLSGLDVALNQLGNEWMTESVARIKVQMNAVFGIALLFVAVIVGFMAAGLVQMQVQLATTMQQVMH